MGVLRFAIPLAWAAGVMAVWEAKFPFRLGGAWQATAESLAAAQNPFTISGLGAIAGTAGGNALALAVFALCLAACLGMGIRLRDWAGRGEGGFLLEWLAGAVTAGLALLGLALLGLFRAPVLAVFTAATAAFMLCRSPASGSLAPRPEAVPSLPAAPGFPGTTARTLSLASLAVLLVALLTSETGMDALQYHIALPGRVAATGKMTPCPNNFFFDLMVQGELLRGWGLAAGGDPAARLWGLAALAAGGAALFAAVKRLAGSGWGWVAAAAWLTSPFACELARAGKPDLFMAPLALAAFFLLARAPGAGTAVLAGAFAGAAVSFKMTAAVPAAVLIIIPLLAFRRRGSGAAWRSSAAALAGAAAAAVPWLVKAWLLTRDPLYPFLKLGFGMLPAGVDAYREFITTVSLRGLYDTPLRKVVSLWTTTMADGLPPFWLALLPLTVLAPAARTGRVLLGCASVGWAWWTFLPQARFGIPWLVWLAAASVAALASLPEPVRRPARWLAAALLLLQVLRTLVDTASSGSLAAGLGFEAPRDHFRRKLTSYADMIDEVGRLPRDSRVLIVGDRRSYPRPRPFILSSMHEPFPVYDLVRESASSGELARRMRQLNVTHVAHNHVAALYFRNLQTMYPWTRENLGVWADYWRRHARLVAPPARLDLEEGGFYLYRLSRTDLPRIQLPTLPGIEGVFSSIEGHLRAGMIQRVGEFVAALENIAGDVPEVKYFVGRVWYGYDSYTSLERLRRADAGGLRALTLWDDIARIAEREGRLAEALRYYAKVHSFEPRSSPEAYVRVLLKEARLARKRQRTAEYEALLRRALALVPDRAALWVELAQVLLWRKRAEEARGAAREAVRLDPASLRHPFIRALAGAS